MTYTNLRARMLAEYSARTGQPPETYCEPVGPDLTGPDPSEYANITRLARANMPLDFVIDSFARPMAGNSPEAEAEIIDWSRPGGGRVVAVGSIDAGRAFFEDGGFRAFVRNVLQSFGV